MSDTGIADTPDRHSCILIGRDTLFACHVGMFYVPNHRYQVVLEIGLPEYARRIYVEDREAHPDDFYTIINVETDLVTLPAIRNGQTMSFIAHVARGAPVDPALVANVRATVERVVCFRQADASFEYPPTLTYLLFGAGTEAHMTHLLTRDPDFQHIVELDAPPEWLPPQQLRMGANVNFPHVNPARPVCRAPLDAKSYQVHYQGLPPVYELAVGRSVYFTASAWNRKDPCPDEDAHA